MKKFLLLAVWSLSVLPTAAVRAQDNSITQIGEWTCRQDLGPKFKCDEVTFKPPFGSPPSVALGLSGYATPFAFPPPPVQAIVSIKVEAKNITAQGFTPELTFDGHEAFKTYTGSWVAVGSPEPVQGTANPKYVVLLVLYAPPGTNGGKSTSSVTYGAGSTTGTTTSSSATFKQTYAVAVDSGAGLFGNGGGAGLSFAYSRSTTDDQSLDIKKSSNTRITRPGPAVDGIDHDRDAIYLWLNPTVNLAVTSSSASWTFAGTDKAEIQYVYAGWLKNPSCHQDSKHQNCMPDNVRDTLKKFGVTENDFPDILQRDPLMNGSNAIDPKRFQSLNFIFPYEPPYSVNDPVPTTTFDLSNTSTVTAGSKVTDDYKVEVTLHGEGKFLGLVKASIKNTDTWEWSNTSSTSTSTATTETASVTIGGPAYGYAGPTDIAIYFDTVYRSFAFATVQGLPVALKGTLVDSANRPVPFKQVFVAANGITHRTLTNPKGQWRFLGAFNGPCTIQTDKAEEKLSECATKESIKLKAKP